jgi:hypothetical protein
MHAVKVMPAKCADAAGYAEVDVWSVVYRANGFVGAVTIVGPDATEASAKKLAYQYAAQTLT